MKTQKTPQQIIEILQSIKDVRLDKDGDLEVLFDPPSLIFSGGYEPNRGFIHNGFTHQLLCLIEEALKGELEG